MSTYLAVLADQVIARSDETIVLEGNRYFPFRSVRADVLVPTDTTTICPWKGRAGYFALQVGERRIEDAAWIYRRPSVLARRIRDHVAFSGPVRVYRLA